MGGGITKQTYTGGGIHQAPRVFILDGKTKEYGQGFSDCSSSDRLTDEQENEIAENIFDWWISGVSYEKWYANKFKQLKLF